MYPSNVDEASPEMKQLYQRFALAFESQIIRHFKNVFLNNDIDSSELDLYVPDIRQFTNLTPSQKDRLNSFKKKIVESIDKKLKSHNLIKGEKKDLESFKFDLSSFQGVEFDLIIFILKKDFPDKAVELVIRGEREIKMVTPCCFIGEITLRGSHDTLISKIRQVIKQIIFMTAFPKTLYENDQHLGNIVAKLILNQKMNIYPFVIVNGELTTQHHDFDNLQFYQRDTFLRHFNFYKMLKGVSKSSTAEILNQHHQYRIDHDFKIDLLHFVNEYYPEKLYDKMISVKEDHEQQFKNMEDQLILIRGELVNVGNINTRMGNVETTVNAMGLGLGDLETTVNAMGLGLGDLETTVNAMGLGLGELETTVDAMGVKLGGVETTINNVNKRLGDLETTINVVDTKLKGLEDNTKTINTNLSTLEERMNDNLNSLEERMNDNLNSLEERMKANVSNLESAMIKRANLLGTTMNRKAKDLKKSMNRKFRHLKNSTKTLNDRIGSLETSLEGKLIEEMKKLLNNKGYEKRTWKLSGDMIFVVGMAIVFVFALILGKK